MSGFSQRSTLLWTSAGVLAALIALLFGPELTARVQVNRFSAALARQWTPDTLIPTADACPPAGDARALGAMQGALARAQDGDPHRALHEGQLACLQGDVRRAGDRWLAGLNASFVPDPALLLDAAIARFAVGETLKTTRAAEISRYAARQSREREKDALDTAIGWQEMAFVYDPGVGAGNRLAALYQKAGREEDAAWVWARLQAATSPDEEAHWLAQARVRERDKDWAAAMSAYLQAAALAQTPANAYSDYLKAGAAGRRAKRFDDAVSAYQKALDLLPDKIDAYLGLGETYRAQKEYDEAAAWFQRARGLFPDDYRPPYYLGLVARAQERYEEALAYFEQSLEWKPDNPGALYYKAVTLDALQRRGEAIQALSQAIAHHRKPPESWQKLLAKWRRYPDYAQDPDRWWERGRAAEKEKDWARAAAIYAEGAGKAQPPDDYRLLEREALMHRYLKEWDQAAAIYEDLVQRYPDKINAYLGLGETYRAQKEYDEAAAWFQRARGLFPDDYRPPYYLGLVARAQERYEEALAYFEQSLEWKPDNPGALYYKAVTLDALQRRGEAIQALSQAIAHHRKPPESWQKLLDQWQNQP